MNSTTVIIVGAGIFGVTAALELKRRGHHVQLLDPGPLPHPLAASTDISKVVRMEYGSDEDYMELAERALEGWRAWNQEFGVDLFHETGVLYLRQSPFAPGDFEYESWQLLNRRGHHPDRLGSGELCTRFPAWNATQYVDALYNPEGGYAESGRVVARLVERAVTDGIELLQGDRLGQVDQTGERVTGVILEGGRHLAADQVVVAVGAWTPFVLPFTREFLRPVGQPIFHLKPQNPERFQAEHLPVFSTSATNGYYGFPINREGIVKIANHGAGREMHPESPERQVTVREELDLRAFLADALPELADAPLAHARVCLYCDTRDGDFWIAPDPERPGLVLATGDSGHAFKFAPVLGPIIADAVEGRSNPILTRFRWRPEIQTGQYKEAARYLAKEEGEDTNSISAR